MSEISKLVFLRSLSASSGHNSDIRVVEARGDTSSRQWIDAFCQNGILDFGSDGEFWGDVQSSLKVDVSDWSSSVRYFQAFTASEVHHAARTENDLDVVLTKAASILTGQHYRDIEEVMDSCDPCFDTGIWIGSQRARFTTIRLWELMSRYYVIASSAFSFEHSEYLVNPVYGEAAARRFCQLLNGTVGKSNTDPVFFYVRLGDLPEILNSDDTQLKLINWLSDRQIIPRAYTTVEKCEVLMAADRVAGSWLNRAKQLFE